MACINWHGLKNGGVIHESINKLTNLKTLSIYENQLKRNIPGLSSLANLQFLSIDDRQLSNDISQITLIKNSPEEFNLKTIEDNKNFECFE